MAAQKKQNQPTTERVITKAQLLRIIDAFQKKHGLSDPAFGELALNDKGFVTRLRGPGKTFRLATADKIIAFTETYVAPPKNCPTCGNRLTLHQQAKFTACNVKPKQK